MPKLADQPNSLKALLQRQLSLDISKLNLELSTYASLCDSQLFFWMPDFLHFSQLASSTRLWTVNNEAIAWQMNEDGSISRATYTSASCLQLAVLVVFLSPDQMWLNKLATKEPVWLDWAIFESSRQSKSDEAFLNGLTLASFCWFRFFSNTFYEE